MNSVGNMCLALKGLVFPNHDHYSNKLPILPWLLPVCQVYILFNVGYLVEFSYVCMIGCDVNVLNLKRISPLYVACEKNDDIIARKILENPRFSSKILRIPSVPQPLFAAVSSNHVHLVDLLIKSGCDINMVSVQTFVIKI